MKYLIVLVFLVININAQSIDSLFLKFDGNNPGVAVAVVKDGETVYNKCFGLANLEYNIPITDSTVFHIGSVSKQFTGYALAKLIRQGKLSLNNNVRDFIPELPDYGDTITIGHLIYHTSGLQDVNTLVLMAGWMYEDVNNQEQALDIIYSIKGLNHKPGEKWQYTNSGYILLAEIIKRVSGKSLPDWSMDNIFKPLGMKNTFILEDNREIIRNRAYGYYCEDKGYKVYNVNYTNYGPGGVYSTTKDLVKWSNHLAKSDLKDLMEKQCILNNGDTNFYALGQAIVPYKGVERIFHNGTHAGSRAALIRFIKNDLSIIVLANQEDIDETGLAEKVADIYLADVIDEGAGDDAPKHPDKEDVKAFPINEQDLIKLTGTYYCKELDSKFVVKIEDHQLVLQHSKKLNKIKLTPTGENRFKGNEYYFDKVCFSDSCFTASSIRTKNIRFDKLKR